MTKITFIGAGSLVFTKNLVRDLLTFPAFEDCTIALMDIDSERLGFAKSMVEKIIAAGHYGATVEATTNRAEALTGADGVVTTILVGDLEVWRTDLEIPKKYGVDINIGDTRGPSGIFRFLRTLPAMMDICRDIECYCPDAIFLNYTNPMAMLCRAMQSESKLQVTGLCHSVQGTAAMLARWIGAPMNEITYRCAGINHQAFYLDYKWNNKDAYPLIREAVLKRPEIYNEEQVRNEMFLHLDYYVTESSGHNSEYNAWFRKRPDLIEKYCTHGTGWNPGEYAMTIKHAEERRVHWQQQMEEWRDSPIDLQRGEEYAAYIFDATIGSGNLFEFNGNVRNFGLIDNLPEGCCVEVPVLASKGGLSPIHVGPLPDQLALLVNTSARCEELAVEGALTGDPRKIFHAICFDPLTSAVLSLEEIKNMVDEMFAANREWLPQFKHLS
ncbi:alpha-galactosidase [Pullulanibacillus pueri]|uniref:Alpha-glucosidase/alpha-galactosidase n=1 Tax=Pullulanibacillus pueri TaxID=1437324 RepID=A0A8J2ZRR2_9BACL|nr:alpha-galactosidase [Pullulanibacillus pueri]MBM7679972.1 alpha-galactosidase [Pullulanibacillus pueri]GGH73739.1 alpha-glucosidase/alpha-galactosidase [Pullulanibacillus pueri]